MSTHSQDQDLRTALEPSEKQIDAAAEAILSRRGFGYYTDPMEGGEDAYYISCEAREAASVALKAALRAAPPRPVDAERVAKPSWVDRAAWVAGQIIDMMPRDPDLQPSRGQDGLALPHLLFMADELHGKRVDGDTKACRWLGWLQAGIVNAGLADLETMKKLNLASKEAASPAHSPDKAVTREGVADEAARWAATLRNSMRTSRKGWSQFHDSEINGLLKVLDRAATPTPPVSPTPGNTGSACLWDDEPDCGAKTREPSLRQIIRNYYAPHFSSEKSDELTERYIAALTPSAPIAAPVRDAPEACLDVSRRKLARITGAWEAKANLDDGDICFLIRMAEQRLNAAPVRDDGTLTLEALHAANAARQTEWCQGGDAEPDLAFRGNELAGETGEACNVIKKLERERHGWRGSRATLADLAEELADVVICADLCAVTAGIDLGAAVVAKFNATSDKVGISVRLPTPASDVPGEAQTHASGWKNEHCNGEPEAAETPDVLVSGALADIATERHRQVETEGWSPAHDDDHAHGEIARAAACYALPQGRRWAITEGLWPWDRAWWKPGDRRRDLVKAGALIVAEIERLDRKHQAWVEKTAADVARDSDFSPI